MTTSLALKGIRKSFDGVVVLDDAEFSGKAGEVHALLGENGAGKSSLMNVAAGLYAPEAGHIVINGAPVALSGPAEARAYGIGMVHQHFKLVMPFTVAENILLANRTSAYRASIKEIRAAIKKQSDELGFTLDPDRRVDTLSVAQQQQVEIVKVLVGGAKILILDEPTAVLTDAEAEQLLATVRRLARAGTAVVLITHKLNEVKRYADAVTIMRRGKTVATVDPSTTTAAELTQLTVGETADATGAGAERDHRDAPQCRRADLRARRRRHGAAGRDVLCARRGDLRDRRRQRQRPDRARRSADGRPRTDQRRNLGGESRRHFAHADVAHPHCRGRR